MKKNTPLRSLIIISKVGDSGAEALANGLKENRHLRKLFMLSSKIKAIGFEKISQALEHNTALKELLLPLNYPGERGTAAIAKLLKVNKTITKLDLSNAQLYSKGAKILAEALKENRTLKDLDLSANYMGQTKHSWDPSARPDLSGIRALLAAIATNQGLESLTLNHTFWDPDLLVDLGQMLEKNKKLKRFILERGRINEAGSIAIGKALKVNKTLTELVLSDMRK